MPEDKLGIKEQIHIVLRDKDGNIKDERKPKKQKVIKEIRNV